MLGVDVVIQPALEPDPLADQGPTHPEVAYLTGVLGAANSAGAIAGSFLALFLAGRRAKGMLVLYATFAYALILFGFGSVTSLWLGAVMIAGLGGADAVTVAVRQATVQLTTPDHMRGRAYAFLVLAAQTANNVGTIWVGFWAAAIGAPNTMLLGAALATLATIVITVWHRRREVPIEVRHEKRDR